MPDSERAVVAHLLRRAGFGATPEELEHYVSKGYEATVEELLNPVHEIPFDEDVVRRYHMDQNSLMLIESAQAYWIYRMINSKRPLDEKIALFWHHLFATAYGKLNHAKGVVNQTNMFRRCGLGHFRTLLLELARDPAMIFWLDNKDNHKDAPNENFGRELLELFSMGIGNYTEADVKACARAFTGWTIANQDYMSIRASRDSIWPHGRLDWQFVYRPEDHDDTEKTFLGHTGRFNGEDVIDIICEHPATAWFVASQLYTFFVSDTIDEGAVQTLADEFTRTNGHIGSVMRVLFTVRLLPLRICPLLPRQEPGGTGSRNGPAGRQPPLPRLEHHQPGDGRQFHGPGNPEPSVGGGLAYRRRVDRHRQLGRAHQLRRPGSGRRKATRREGHHPAAAGARQRPVASGICGRLLGPGRKPVGLGRYPRSPHQLRRVPRRPALRHRRCRFLLRPAGRRYAPIDSCDPRVPTGLITRTPIAFTR